MAPKKKKEPNKRPTDAEYLERLRIVEALIIAGKGSSLGELVEGLAALGRPGLTNRRVSKYAKIVRDRLAKVDDNLRNARREVLIQKVQSDSDRISKLLKNNDIMPRWADLVQSRKLISELLAQTPSEPMGPALPGEGEDLDEIDEAKLDDLLREMLERLDTPETSGSAKAEADTTT